MGTRSKLRRTLAACGLAAATLTASVAMAAPASADPDIPIVWNVDATTHLKKLNLDTDITGGTFDGVIDLGTLGIEGDLTLPPAETSFELLGLDLASVGFAIESIEPTTGTVDLSTMSVTMTSKFHIKIPYARAFGSPYLNMVGSRCQTSEPVTLTMSGPVDLVNGSTFSGEYTIPKLKDCGLLTWGLNLVIPGDGNTFSATAYPPA